MPWVRAPAHRERLRPRPRPDRGLHAPRAVPRVRRRAPAARVARGHDRRQEHLRGRRAVDPRLRSRSSRRSSCRERDRMIAERVFKEVLERLQFMLDVGLDYLSLNRSVGHARRRRGAAHPARVADRQRARRRAVRARRAVDRPAPARQPAPHRDARAAAQPRQHRDRRRARRGDDPRRRPRRRHRAGRGGARRRDHRVGHGQGRPEVEGVDHRPVPVGEAQDRRPRRCAASRATRGSPCAARASTTSRTSTSSSRSAASSRSPA